MPPIISNPRPILVVTSVRKYPIRPELRNKTPITAVIIPIRILSQVAIKSKDGLYTKANGMIKAQNPNRNAAHPVWLRSPPLMPAAAYAATATGGVIKERMAKYRQNRCAGSNGSPSDTRIGAVSTAVIKYAAGAGIPIPKTMQTIIVRNSARGMVC